MPLALAAHPWGCDDVLICRVEGDLQKLAELKRTIKEVRGISRENVAKFSVGQGRRQNCATQEKAGFSVTCCAVE